MQMVIESLSIIIAMLSQYDNDIKKYTPSYDHTADKYELTVLPNKIYLTVMFDIFIVYKVPLFPTTQYRIKLQYSLLDIDKPNSIFLNRTSYIRYNVAL